MPAPEVDVKLAAAKHAASQATLLDVREPGELRIVNVPGALHVPMSDVPTRLQDIPKDRDVLVMCHHGGRSQVVADWLHAKGYRAYNVAGGIHAWAHHVDPTMAKY